MKKIYLLLLLPIVMMAQEPEPVDCADLAYTPADVIYINQSTDTYVYGTLDYSGNGDLNYAVWSYSFPEGSPINITETVTTHGVIGPFHYENVLGHKIVYNQPNIPANTVVNATRTLTHMSVPDGCSKPVTFIINSTAGLENIAKKTVTAYPNPFKDELTLKIGTAEQDIIIHDALGRTVKTIKNASGTVRISREGLPAGVYFIAAYQNGKHSATTKVIASL